VKPYSLIQLSIPVLGGIKYNITPGINFFIEFGPRITFTDYLDDVSTVFPDKQTLTDTRGPIAAALSDRSLIDGLGAQGRQRGDTKGKDKYAFVGISIVRYFGGIECPDISRIQ